MRFRYGFVAVEMWLRLFVQLTENLNCISHFFSFNVFSSMYSHMVRPAILMTKRLPVHFTWKLFFSSVYSHMVRPAILMPKRLPAHFTCKMFFLLCVFPYGKTSHSSNAFPHTSHGKVFFSSVYSHMVRPAILMPKRLPAHFTCKRFFSSVYSHMCVQTPTLTKCLPAHFTWKRFFSSVYSHMCI